MSLSAFIQALFESGETRVPLIADVEELGGTSPPKLVPEDEREQVITLLAEYELVVRAGWPMQAPDFDGVIALHAAAYLYQAARLILSRHVSGGAVLHILADDAITANTPSAHYSVDLACRFLPDLFRMAGGRLTEDPLTDRLSRFGGRWPISSIGVPDTTPSTDRLDVVLDHPSLYAVYIDRVLERADPQRLDEPRVAASAGLVIREHSGLVSQSIQHVIEQHVVSSTQNQDEELS